MEQALTLTKERISQLYSELETLSVPLEKNPQRGLQYLREKIVECRTMQDRAADMLIQVRKLHPAVRTAVRNYKGMLHLMEQLDPRRAEVNTSLSEVQDQDDEIRYLVEVIKAKQSNLKMTSSDIRLLYSVVEQQLKLGEIQPGRQGEVRTELTKSSEPPPRENAEAPGQAPIERDSPVSGPDSPVVDYPPSQDVLSIESFLERDEPSETKA